MTKLPNRKWDFSMLCYCGNCAYTKRHFCPATDMVEDKKPITLRSSRAWEPKEYTEAQEVLSRHDTQR